MKSKWLYARLALFFLNLHIKRELVPFAKKYNKTKEQLLYETGKGVVRQFDLSWPD